MLNDSSCAQNSLYFVLLSIISVRYIVGSFFILPTVSTVSYLRFLYYNFGVVYFQQITFLAFLCLNIFLMMEVELVAPVYNPFLFRWLID